MIKPCITCHSKPIKNGIYKSELQHFAEKELPKDNKCYHRKESSKNQISGLKPNKTIFYFATQERDFTKSIQNRLKAYGKLTNSGVTNTDLNGNCNIYLDCPQLYLNDDDNVYSRHYHFIYWDNKKLKWDKNLFTQQILCNVDDNFILKHMKKSIIVDARLKEYYEKSHIKNAISLPYIKNWTDNSIFEELKKGMKNYNNNKLVPIIIYCSKDNNNGHDLYKKLNKHGFYNTVHAKGNLINVPHV
jgi:rhodanese-related sulfurtransferase